MAPKVLKSQGNQDLEARERFQEEARHLSKPDHPNICRAFGFGWPVDGDAYIVLAFAAGVSLQEKPKNGPVSPADAQEIGIRTPESAVHSAA